MVRKIWSKSFQLKLPFLILTSNNSVFVICLLLVILVPSNAEAQNIASFAKEILPLNNNLHQGILVVIGVLIPGIVVIIVIEWIRLKQKVPKVKDKTEPSREQRNETVGKSSQTKDDDYEWKGI